MTFKKGDEVRVHNDLNDYTGKVALIDEETQATLSIAFEAAEVPIMRADGETILIAALGLVQSPPGHYEDMWGGVWNIAPVDWNRPNRKDHPWK